MLRNTKIILGQLNHVWWNVWDIVRPTVCTWVRTVTELIKIEWEGCWNFLGWSEESVGLELKQG